MVTHFDVGRWPPGPSAARDWRKLTDAELRGAGLALQVATRSVPSGRAFELVRFLFGEIVLERQARLNLKRCSNTAAWRSVDCPACGGRAGGPCRSMSGRRVGRSVSYTHRARGAAWRKKARAK